MAYVVTLGGDGSVDFGENPVPLLFEYKYRWTKVKDEVGGERFVLAAEDWLNLMDAFEAAQAAGLADPSDAEGGAVFEVDFRRVPVPNSDKKKDVFVHRHVPLARTGGPTLRLAKDGDRPISADQSLPKPVARGS